MKINPVFVVKTPAPSKLACYTCIGWGTVFKHYKDTNNKIDIQLAICEKCAGTGRIPIPKKDME